MNNLLNLRGRFEQEPRLYNGFGSKLMYKNTIVTIEMINKRIKELESIYEHFDNSSYISGILVNVDYVKLAAKSNRISNIFKYRDKEPNDSIVGAKFNEKGHHRITHFVSKKNLINEIEKFKNIWIILNEKFNEGLTSYYFNNDDKSNLFDKAINLIEFKNYNISKTTFKTVIADLSYIDKFSFPIFEIQDVKEETLVSFYDVKENINDLLQKIFDKPFPPNKIIGNLVLLNNIELETIKNNAPYLISMELKDFSKYSIDDNLKIPNQDYSKLIDIKNPTNEPTIGVIDTLFDERVYFSKWVEYKKIIPEDILVESNDFKHGTKVSSLIVDGHRLNPELDDGCGHFKVRHFGVSLSKGYSEFSILKSIKEIVSNNIDIVVWNISLGSNNEVSKDYISPIAEELDKLQYKYNVIFVIAGTNFNKNLNNKKIGSPADSINSLVVNSVDFITKRSANYSRKGNVLNFFIKPDVSYYGGTDNMFIKTCGPLGLVETSGTSYASPFIARKLSYLIDILGFDREVAKAMIIDSAIGWKANLSEEYLNKIGHGIVPVKIEDIIKSPNDEIRFIIKGVSEKYNTYNFNLPVPRDKNGKYPYFSKATMAYFTDVKRSQGVDYTNTELSLKFGILNNKNELNYNGKKIIDDEYENRFEADARKIFRKWDTVKHLKDFNEEINNRKLPRKYYDDKKWGIKLTTNERIKRNDGVKINFGIVITLKEMFGENRIEEFKKLCILNGWIVETIEPQTNINIYNRSETDVVFDG